MNKAFTLAAVLIIVSLLAFAAAMQRAETLASGGHVLRLETTSCEAGLDLTTTLRVDLT